MPIIGFKTADILKSKVMEEEWCHFIISHVSEPVKSKSSDSYNYNVTFTLCEYHNPDLNGKEIVRSFSAKAIGMMLPLIAAVRGVKVADIPPADFQLDTDELVGKKIDGKIKVDVYEGNPNNKLEEYAPYKSCVGAAPAF